MNYSVSLGFPNPCKQVGMIGAMALHVFPFSRIHYPGGRWKKNSREFFFVPPPPPPGVPPEKKAVRRYQEFFFYPAPVHYPTLAQGHLPVLMGCPRMMRRIGLNNKPQSGLSVLPASILMGPKPLSWIVSWFEINV